MTCAICGEPCNGTQGIVGIGHCCDACIGRWRAGDQVAIDGDEVTWEVSTEHDALQGVIPLDGDVSQSALL